MNKNLHHTTTLRLHDDEMRTIKNMKIKLASLMDDEEVHNFQESDEFHPRDERRLFSCLVSCWSRLKVARKSRTIRCVFFCTKTVVSCTENLLMVDGRKWWLLQWWNSFCLSTTLLSMFFSVGDMTFSWLLTALLLLRDVNAIRLHLNNFLCDYFIF